MKRLEKALKPHLVEVNEVVKHQSFSSQEEGELDA